MGKLAESPFFRERERAREKEREKESQGQESEDAGEQIYALLIRISNF